MLFLTRKSYLYLKQVCEGYPKLSATSRNKFVFLAILSPILHGWFVVRIARVGHGINFSIL